MGTLVLAGATSGSATLTPVDAVTAVITLPSATATLATLGANTYTAAQSVSVAGGVNLLTLTSTNNYSFLKMVGTGFGGEIDFFNGATALASVVGTGSKTLDIYAGNNAATLAASFKSTGTVIGTGANSFLQLGNGASSFGCGIWFSADNSSNSWLIDCYDYGASRFSMAQSTGAGAIGSTATERLYVANGGTSWTAASDETVKDITGEFVGALDQVAKSRTVRGAYKYDPDTKHSFLIAQDWQDYLPEAISLDKNGKLGLSYVETIPVAFAAIKELDAMVKDLTARLAALEAK